MEKEHYEIILALLAEKVKEQESRLGYLGFIKSDLEKKLAEAEAKGGGHEKNT